MANSTCLLKASAMGLLALGSPSATPGLRGLTGVLNFHTHGLPMTSNPAAPTAPRKKRNRGKGECTGTDTIAV
jgi:hypothetical protein